MTWLHDAAATLRAYEQIQAWVAQGRVVHPHSGLYLSRYLSEYQERHARDMMQAAREERRRIRDEQERRENERQFGWLLTLAEQTERVAKPRHIRQRTRARLREDRGFTNRSTEE